MLYNKQTIIIIDCDNKTALNISRKARAMNVFCEIVLPSESSLKIKERNTIGIIFAGENFDNWYYEELEKIGVPILKVSSATVPETILGDFIFEVCNAHGDWRMEDYAESQISEIRKKSDGKKILLALSGGVDSTVCAALIGKAIGENLFCVFVDHGLMRKNEPDEIEAAFKNSSVHFIRVDARERFLNKLKGITEPEQKRKIIGEEFIRVFEDEKRKLTQNYGKIDFLAQGTIYPDIVESRTASGEVIKSHHNVGGMPENLDFEGVIEPLIPLFKEEVRLLGRFLSIDEKILTRQPFPGPGLAVRVIGDITKEKLDVLRDADFIFRKEMEEYNLSVSQCFAVLTSCKSVGVENGKRTYGYTVALRAISTTDFMTADFVKIPYEILERVSKRITLEIPLVNRVVYDITSKPPATIEWE